MNRDQKITHSIGLILLLLIAGQSLYAQQYDPRKSQWLRFRHEVGATIGMTAFLGELGGANAIGSDGLRDWNFNENKLAVSLDYQYYLKRNFSVRGNFLFAYLAGDDSNTTEPFRYNRNLSFRAPMYELSGMLQYYLMREEPGMKSHFIKQKFTMNLYVFLGVGINYFNPQAKYNGSWVNLQPLGTEGQGIDGQPAPYSRVTAVIPMGFGLSKKCWTYWMLGLEFSYRKTFSDYIDDVSTVYYNNDKIYSERGEMAAYLADPSHGYYIDNNGNEVPLNSTSEGLQRGDPEDKDAYLTGSVTVRYFLAGLGKKRSRPNRSRL
jgi:hypothetical protein